MAPTSQGSPISQRSRSKPPPPRSLAATALTSACWSVDRTRTDAPLGWGAAFCALRSRRFLAVSVRNPSIIGQFCAEKRRVRREHSTVSSSRAQGWAPAGRQLGAGWAPAGRRRHTHHYPTPASVLGAIRRFGCAEWCRQTEKKGAVPKNAIGADTRRGNAGSKHPAKVPASAFPGSAARGR
jgi:hypothetical protein